MNTVIFEPVCNDFTLPKMSTDGSAAYDVYCCKDTLVPYGRSLIPLGFKTEFPATLEALIEPRSGFELKGFEGYTTSGEKKRYDCDVLTGKIDSDYRGEVNVIVKNNDKPFYCKAGTRIAQLTFVKIDHPRFVVGKVDETDRASGGFGHSGTL